MERVERGSIWVALLVASLPAILLPPPAAAKAAALPGGDAPSRIVIAQAGQGEPALLVEGQVFRADGKTPAAGIVLYVYHTDRAGRYGARPGEPPRFRGWVRTDGEGRYTYRTIRPAPYPGQHIPAHVHVQMWGDGAPPQWGTELLFADDPLVPAAERHKSAGLGHFAYVCSPRRDARGVERCRHDLRLKTTGDRFEPSTRHGFSAAVGR
jgi:protocatechuate 3,4-dioxygenase beta subunit